MTPHDEPPPATHCSPLGKKMRWAGYVVSALPVLGLTMSAVMKFVQPQQLVEGFPKLGYDLSLAVPLGIVEIVCTLIYVVPGTAVLGAILLTGYLGGATATHVRVGEPFFFPVILGVLVWLGLYLRDDRVRALLPWRR
jgi:DoxX-like family